MLIVGAVVWVLYLVYANVLTLIFHINHFIAEISGIPFSWIVSYAINTKFNFDLPFAWKRFEAFCTISSVGWLFYELTTWICTDILGWYSMIGTIIGVGTQTVMNVVLQQGITFGLMSRGFKKGTVKTKSTYADYDWNAYYNGNVVQRWWKQQICKHVSNFVEEGSVLDIGCGSSPILSLLKNFDKYGVDTNKDKIEFMLSKDKSSIYTYSTGILPFRDNTFDNVMCNEVIEHVPKPHELLKEIRRVVKDNGNVIISTPDFGTIRWNLIEILYGWTMNSGYESEHGSKFTRSILVDMADIYGFQLVNVIYVAGCDMVCKFRKVGVY